MDPEIRTRLVPWSQIEFAHARNRPHHERPSVPKVGDKVWYRHEHWERDSSGAPVPPELCTVIAVADLDDRSDPNLWEPVRDPLGGSVLDADGTQLYAPLPDPWPWIDLKRPDRHKPDGGFAGYGQTVRTMEARVRGSAGWLPLDYRTRPERHRLPAETALVARPEVLPAVQRAREAMGGT